MTGTGVERGGNGRGHLAEAPPHNIDAEMSILGALLLGGSAVDEILQLVRPDEFYRSAHREILSTIQDLRRQGAEIDGISVAEELRRRGTLAEVGGENYLIMLAEIALSTASTTWHAGIVRDKAESRVLIAACTDLIRKAAQGHSAADLLAELQGQVAAVTDRLQSRLRSRFKGYSLAELGKLPPVEWTVDGVLQAGVPSMLWAKYAAGKSLSIARLLGSVASGEPMFGRQVLAGPCIYCDAEGGPGTRARLDAVVAAMGIDPKVFDENVLIVPAVPRLLHPLDVADFVRFVKAWLRGRAARLIAFDTWAKCLHGGDENKTADVNIAVESVREIVAQLGGPATIAVHHQGRPPAQPGEKGHARGSTVLDCDVNGMFRLEDKDGDITLTVEKQKDGQDGLTFRMRKTFPIEGGAPFLAFEGEGATPAAALPDRDQDELDALHAILLEAEAPGLKVEVLKARMGIRSEGKITRLLKKLHSQGLADRREDPVPGRGFFHYGIRRAP